tara:strand:+ start:440 stop:886 length:447 start_codon:yes stop_codon:yes gene_type:complete
MGRSYHSKIFRDNEKFKKWKMEKDNLTEEEYEEYAKGGRKYDIEWNKYLNTEESKESRREIWEDELEIRREFLERMKAVQQNLERIQDRLHPNNENNPDSEPFFVCKSRYEKIKEIKSFNSMAYDIRDPNWKRIINKWSHLFQLYGGL